MKVIALFAALLISLSIVPYIDAQEGEWNLELVFEIPVPDIMDTDAGALLLCSGWSPSGRIGSPLLPERTYHIPLGHSMVEMVSFQFIEESLMRIDRPLRLSPSAGCGDLVIDRDEETKAPAVRMTGMISGKSGSYAVIRLSPYSYTDGTLVFPEEVNVRLIVEPSIGRRTVRVTEDKPMVVRRDDSDAQPVWQEAPPAAQDTMPSTYYHNTTPPTKLVIITSSTYNSTFRPLANWKTAKGVYTRVVETSWIYGKYSGTDNPEKIRKYLIDLYKNEELEWVILGGDNDVVPTRLAYVPDGYDDSGSDGSYVATDAYYSDLDGTGHTPYDWDGDSDGLFGEYSDDSIDLWPEVFVGRLSGNSASELSEMVSSIIKYEKDPATGGWYNRSVMAGAYSNYRRSSTVNDTTDEADLKEAIRVDFLSSGYKTYTLYEKAGIWPSQQSCDANLTTNNVVSAIDPGAFMVNMAGHGSSTGIYRRIWNSDSNGNGLCDSGEYSDTAYYSTSASQSNGEKRPLFYNDACNNGEFDRVTNCLTEDILRDVGIGAVGSSRVSWYAVHWTKGSDGGYYNQGHDYRFWEQFFGSGDQQPGKALYLSKYDYINDKTAHDKYSWKNLLQYNLMGDPEIPIWTKTPEKMTVTYTDPSPSPGTLMVTVKDASNQPIKDARVCIMNGTVFYSIALTNSTGIASFSLPELLMDLNLTVTALNFKPYLGKVSIGEDDDPPRIDSLEFEGNDTTGDPYRISASVSDAAGIGYVNLHWNRSVLTPATYQNVTMLPEGAGVYVLAGNNPSDSVLPLWFRVIASDIRGNVNISSWRSVQIYDNDAPIIHGDLSDIIATTGDPFNFSLDAHDNIGIVSSKVNYSMDGGSFVNSSLSGSGPYVLTIDVPSNATGTLSYSFYVEDAMGNMNRTTDVHIQIIDDDPPYMVEDLTDGIPTTGDRFTLSMRAGDNIGVNSVHVEYRFGNATPVNSTMAPSGVFFEIEIDVADDEIEPLRYRYMITDTSGNTAWTNIVNVGVEDDDLPQVTDMTFGSPTTGDPFMIRFSASDNIGIASCHVDHILPGRTMDRIDADPVSGNYEVQISIPSDAWGNLSYRLVAVDTSGNVAESGMNDVTILDDDPPEMLSFEIPSPATTGDEFQMAFELSDNIAIVNASVKWAIGSVKGSVLLNGPTRAVSGRFSGSMTVPASLTGMMGLVLTITDTSGNSNTYDMDPVPVHDNDPPELVSIDHPGNATTGDPFTIEVQMIDNIAVIDVSAEFRCHPGNEIVRMYRSEGIYRATYDVPMNATGRLRVAITAIDSSGNALSLPEIAVDILDDDDPVIASTGGLGSMELTTGGSFTASITAEDNVGIHSVSLIISSLERSSEFTLAGSGPLFEIGFDVWPDISGEALITITVRDLSGNEATRTITLLIRDNDPPSVSIDAQDGDVLLSNGCNLRVRSQDNIGVVDISVHAIKGQSNITLEESAEGFAFLPDDHGLWTIIAIARDASGNIGSARTQLNVIDDIPPVASISPVQKAKAGDTVILKALGEEVDVTWIVKDPNGFETTLTGAEAEFIPTVPGTYSVRMIMKDPSGNAAEDEMTFDVENGASSSSILPLIVGSVILIIVLLLMIAFAILLIARRRKAAGAGEEEFVVRSHHAGRKEVEMEEDDPWG